MPEVLSTLVYFIVNILLKDVRLVHLHYEPILSNRPTGAAFRLLIHIVKVYLYPAGV